jgi:hypothetical protein
MTPGEQAFRIEVSGGVEGDQRYASLADLAALTDGRGGPARA